MTKKNNTSSLYWSRCPFVFGTACAEATQNFSRGEASEASARWHLLHRPPSVSPFQKKLQQLFQCTSRVVCAHLPRLIFSWALFCVVDETGAPTQGGQQYCDNRTEKKKGEDHTQWKKTQEKIYCWFHLRDGERGAAAAAARSRTTSGSSSLISTHSATREPDFMRYNMLRSVRGHGHHRSTAHTKASSA